MFGHSTLYYYLSTQIFYKLPRHDKDKREFAHFLCKMTFIWVFSFKPIAYSAKNMDN